MLRHPIAGAVLALSIASCVRPARLSDECRLSPSSATWAPTTRAGRIEGRVLDRSMKGPIGNLHVRLESAERGVRTDANGQFALDSVPDGRQVVVFDGSGYPVRRDTLVLQPESGLRGDVVLTPDRDVLQRCPLYNP